jgi:hypothetical protein
MIGGNPELKKKKKNFSSTPQLVFITHEIKDALHFEYLEMKAL